MLCENMNSTEANIRFKTSYIYMFLNSYWKLHAKKLHLKIKKCINYNECINYKMQISIYMYIKKRMHITHKNVQKCSHDIYEEIQLTVAQ